MLNKLNQSFPTLLTLYLFICCICLASKSSRLCLKTSFRLFQALPVLLLSLRTVVSIHRPFPPRVLVSATQVPLPVANRSVPPSTVGRVAIGGVCEMFMATFWVKRRPSVCSFLQSYWNVKINRCCCAWFRRSGPNQLMKQGRVRDITPNNPIRRTRCLLGLQPLHQMMRQSK